MLLTFSTLVLTLSAASCQNSGEEGRADTEGEGAYSVLSQEAFRERLISADDYILVDVRTPKEYEEGHIEGAVNVDFLDPAAFDEGAARLDQDKALMIYCRSGKRSRKASEKLKALGFKEIYDLEGGFRSWKN